MPISDLGLDFTSSVVRGTTFEVPRRYKELVPIRPQGASGIVCSAQDVERNETVVIKKFETGTDCTFTMQTLRELRVLRHLQHENVLGVRHVFFPGPKEAFEAIYVVFDLMEIDLASIIRSGQPLSDEHYQFLFYQMMRGLKYIHSAEVIHRDLNPQNLLVNRSCDLKICDFGLACVCHEDEELRTCPSTKCVGGTLWYRGPEVLCCWCTFGKALDIWSMACIFAEMFRRKPLFPGRNTKNQYQLIIQCLGSPSEEDLLWIPRGKCRRFIESMPAEAARPLGDVVPGVTKDGLDVLSKTLVFNPDRRLTVEQVLEHPYLRALHCPEDEPSRDPIDIGDFGFERRKTCMSDLQEEVFLEALRYHPWRREQYLEECRRNGHSCSIAHCYSATSVVPSSELICSSSDDES